MDAVTVNSGGIIAGNIAGPGTGSSLALGSDSFDLRTGSGVALSSVAGFNPDQGCWAVELLLGSSERSPAGKA
ncbi:hypothetical protein [Gemmata sp.]|uniref:hypothetical protein n=1 Tax=Gemmata sp. TaxID=1914242 RepID=UPI003F72EC11